MVLKKIAAVLTSAAMVFSLIPSALSPTVPAADSETVELFCDDFENDDTCGWASHGGAATISLTDTVAYSGTSSMYITDREQFRTPVSCIQDI